MNTCTKHPGWIAGCIKSKEINQKKHQLIIDNYSINPKKCLKCESIISYEKRNNKFCSSACSASYYTKGRKHSQETKNKIAKSYYNDINRYVGRSTAISYNHCINCNTLFISSWRRPTAFCSTCMPQCQSLRSKIFKFGLSGSKQYKYTSPTAGEVLLDSTYEVLLATDLDKNQIKWIRPQPLIWYDSNNKTHRYYPDFFLIDYNQYVEPKNTYLLEFDAEQDKLKRVQNQNNIQLIIISDPKLLTWKHIQEKMEPTIGLEPTIILAET